MEWNWLSIYTAKQRINRTPHLVGLLSPHFFIHSHYPKKGQKEQDLNLSAPLLPTSLFLSIYLFFTIQLSPFSIFHVFLMCVINCIGCVYDVSILFVLCVFLAGFCASWIGFLFFCWFIGCFFWFSLLGFVYILVFCFLYLSLGSFLCLCNWVFACMLVFFFFYWVLLYIFGFFHWVILGFCVICGIGCLTNWVLLIDIDLCSIVFLWWERESHLGVTSSTLLLEYLLLLLGLLLSLQIEKGWFKCSTLQKILPFLLFILILLFLLSFFYGLSLKNVKISAFKEVVFSFLIP